MGIIMVLTGVLCVVTVLIRRRFITDSWISVLLRKKYVAHSLFTCVLALHTTGIMIWFLCSDIDATIRSNAFFLVIMLMTTWCIVSRSFMVRGCIPHTYFTMYGSTLKIDVSRKCLPDRRSVSESKIFACNFVQQLASLDDTPCDRIIIQTHLIQKSMRKRISDRLKSHGFDFSSQPHETTRSEIISLNLLYGGRTRFKLLSTVKHMNGFKVHKTGSRFIIKAGRITAD